MSDQEFIFAPSTVNVEFILLPVESVMNSLILLNQAETTSGFGEWIERTYQALRPEERALHNTIFTALLSGYEYEDAAGSFPEYLDRIAAEQPYAAQARIIESFSHKCEFENMEIAREGVLGDTETFLKAVEENIGAHYREKGYELPLEPYVLGQELLRDPERMHDAFVGHMRMIWEKYMRDEWYRNLPILEESIAAFKQVDFSGMTAAEIIRSVTGRDLTPFWGELENAKQLAFMPSAHLGPYNSLFKRNDVWHIVFGARMPEGVRTASPALSRSELLVQLNALADETRLQILELLAEHDELCAQDFINMLDLSQSSASRHLRQLTAAGYLTERRKDVAKCYSLNPKRANATARALEQFLHGQ